MNTNLIEQIEQYFDEIEAQQLPVAIEEVEARLGVVTADRITPRSNRRGLLVAAATAILVLLAGLVPLLLANDEAPTADTADTTPSSTLAPPSTTPAPSTTISETGFAPRLEGSGVEVSFSVRPVDLTISGESFVVVQADWSIDWVGMAWDWGDDEIRQHIALGNQGNQTKWDPETSSLLVQFNADKPSGEDLIARFTLTYAGTDEEFEIQAHEPTSGRVLATVTGSLPGIDDEQILTRVALNRTWAPSHAGWLYASDNGQLSPLDPPWEQFWGYGDQFFELGDATLALFATDASWNVWRTTDGYVWEDLGEPPLDPYTWFESDVVANELLVNAGSTYWSTSDGVRWEELSETQYETKTGKVIVAPEDIPEAPDPWFPEDLDRDAIDAHFDELAQNAVVISEDPLILQLLPGPEPRFDTSDLGTELPFEALTSGDPRVEWLVQDISSAGDPGPRPDGPVLFIGHLPSSATVPYNHMDEVAGSRMLWAADCRFECLGVEGLQAAGELEGDIWTDRHPGLWIAVPLNTSAVAVRYNADTALWQRPTGGWAIFPVSVDGDDTYWIDAYDADGALIATTGQR